SDSTDIAAAGNQVLNVSDRGNIYELAPSTGELTVLHSSAGSSFSGLAASKDALNAMLFAYEVNGNDDLYRFDQGFVRSDVFLNIIPTDANGLLNAGRGDLAGLAPVPLPGTALLFLGAVALCARRISAV
ncbi:MAG: hypothetical protein K0U93_30300, partial [Gammaproteobacteria bacterium]|nr:hypothetical protein [Gammaproteobacteria bacterium]